MTARIVPTNPPGTNGLKRHASLVPLSRDHHGALMQALWLRRGGEGKTVLGAVGAARDYVAFYENELAGHVADEEDVVLAAAGYADRQGADRVRAEHEELHGLTAALGEALVRGEDPRALMREIGELLHDHVRFEERSFFVRVQERLSPAELTALEGALQEHRERRGAAACSIRSR